MDDISQGSSLYATSQLKLLHEDKETQLLLACGGAGTPPAYLAEERTGLCDKDTHTEVKAAAGLLQLQLLQTNQRFKVFYLAAKGETKVTADFNIGKVLTSLAAAAAGQADICSFISLLVKCGRTRGKLLSPQTSSLKRYER